MWQITWVLGLLPTWFWITVLFLGTVALLATWVLPKLLYSLPVTVISVLAIVISVWSLGAASNEEKWQVRVKELETKLAEAKAESEAANKNIETKVIEKTKVVKGKTQYITEYIDREVIKKEEFIRYVDRCPVPKDVIDVHNMAVEGAKK